MLNKISWLNWEKDVFNIVNLSLIELRKKHKNLIIENELNRELSILLRKYKRQFESKNNRNILGSPVYHAPIQPIAKKIQRFENKIPEYSWDFTDYQKRTTRSYHIECKRLCKGIGKYSREYVLQGIQRYKIKKWCYGINCKSGLMIGYVQGCDFKDFHSSINKHCQLKKIPPLNLKLNFFVASTSFLTHTFYRKFDPTHFRLNHIWIDLR